MQPLPTVSLPIGSVTAYAGDLSLTANQKLVNNAGWLVCDGTSYPTANYPDLFTAIGYSNGNAGAGLFNVPDLRDRFIRGYSGSGPNHTDPDAATRIAAAPGGNTGDAVGSLQLTATALPVKAMTATLADNHNHTIAHLTSATHESWQGGTNMVYNVGIIQTQPAGAHYHAVTGYSATTSPLSFALYYIIKATEVAAAIPGQLPAGIITGLAGNTALPTDWLNCDGTAYTATNYPDLYNNVGVNYGGNPSSSIFNVPDFQGYFMRGSSHSTGRDPDAALRTAQANGGNTGSVVGSVQPTATLTTALATVPDGNHQHALIGGPVAYSHVANGASGPLAHYVMEWTDNTETSSEDGAHTHAFEGGDEETRPENIYLDWLIAGTAFNQDAPPIGSIMPVAVDVTNFSNITVLASAGWIPCTGLSLKIASNQELFDVIGTTFGGGVTDFQVPDLQGYFLKGVGKATLGEVELSATGAPNTAIVTDMAPNHVHSSSNVPTGSTIGISTIAGGVVGTNVTDNNTGSAYTDYAGVHTHPIAGGDAESRPVNVNVDYVIRYK